MRIRSSSTSACTSSPLSAKAENRPYRTSALSRSARMAVSTPGYWTLTATFRPSGSTARWTCPTLAAATGSGSQSPEDALGVVAQLLPDDVRGQARGHRRRVRLQRGQRPLSLLGQSLEDEAEQLPDLHQRALHLAELAGRVLRGADDEAGVELGPPLVGRSGPADLVGRPVRTAPCAQSPHPRRPGDTGASMGIGGDGGGGRHRGGGCRDGCRTEGQPPAVHHVVVVLPGGTGAVAVAAPSAGGRRRATGSAASRSSGNGSPVTSHVQ